MKRFTARRRLVAAGTLLAAVLLGGCSDGDGDMNHGAGPSGAASPSGATASAGFNETDATFATDMISHHEQAIEMARAAAQKSTNQRVKELAKRIEGAQQPEIGTMSGWLRRWGRPVPTAEPTMPGMDHGGMPGMDHGGHAPGMMTQQEMHDLMTASGGAFDKLFLQLMIRHHQGAIEMATTQQRQGQDPAAKELATKIASDQAKEITEMKDILATLS